MTSKISLEQFIKELPVEEPVKKALLERLSKGEDQAVREEVAEMLRQSGLTLSAIEAMEEVENRLDSELQDIEDQAKKLVKSVSEESDKRDLEEARQILN